MAIGPTLVRPVSYPAPRDSQTVAPKSAEPADPLPQAPTAQGQTAQARPTDTPPSASRVARRTTVDTSTGDLVYQVLDPPTGQEIDQTPEESILRIRAYARQMDVAKQADIASSTAVKSPLKFMIHLMKGVTTSFSTLNFNLVRN